MKISEQSKELVNQICAMTSRIGEIEKSALTESLKEHKSSDDTKRIDMMRYALFQDLMCEVHKNIHMAKSVIEDSDEKILKELEEHGTSVDEILIGVLLKMTKNVIEDR